ncbi:MAG TPA: sigma-70 family RNA polymerase sigma factor [Pseudolabrys sp.]|nr:sigma-70 family RNA polymerase sigma factor [Pseudolabrys sp.]
MASKPVDREGAGKAERFKSLALPHLDDAYTLARFLLRNASDADDAVQECFLRAFRHFDSQHGPAVKPWLMAILRNVCRAARSGNRQIAYATDQSEEEVKPLWREADNTAEELLLRQSDSDAMRQLIEQLPDDFREVIVLREINDLSYRDIAAVIDAPIGTVMSRLARARTMLRDAWIAAEGEGRST